MTNLLSRLAIAVAGLPIVIGAAYVGGWFLTIVALVAGLVALHEFYSLAFGLRPLVVAQVEASHLGMNLRRFGVGRGCSLE